ncbi:hypothetical protein DEJ50_01785 [Streptomyces venezuelae]|uniref:Uncharacterized protein n=1 Tax=Streptomyces venezuelae TaxID=54571 RepID=A0A5P2CV36_STRVZ|nr:hypothetical protein [Streptomyces venezuelae]QES46772.1 hypothetical protein DEJ50_01785 [Streptomyces venezuelae]
MTSTNPEFENPQPVPEDPDAQTPDLPPTGPDDPVPEPVVPEEPVEPETPDDERVGGGHGHPTGPGNAPAQEPPD